MDKSRQTKVAMTNIIVIPTGVFCYKSRGMLDLKLKMKRYDELPGLTTGYIKFLADTYPFFGGGGGTCTPVLDFW